MIKSQMLIAIRSIIVDMSENCFHVRTEADCAGQHYVAYLTENDVDIVKFRERLKLISDNGRSLDKKTLIIIKDENFIKELIRQDDGYS